MIGTKVVALPGSTYAAIVGRLSREGIGGGRIYDAIIGESARRGGARTLLTFNPRHFDPPPAGVTVVVPRG